MVALFLPFFYVSFVHLQSEALKMSVLCTNNDDKRWKNRYEVAKFYKKWGFFAKKQLTVFVVCKIILIFATSQIICGKHSRKRIAFICTEKSGKLSRKADVEWTRLLLGRKLYLCSHHRLTSYMSSKGVGCFFYLFTGFTRAFGRIAKGSHFCYVCVLYN